MSKATKKYMVHVSFIKFKNKRISIKNFSINSNVKITSDNTIVRINEYFLKKIEPSIELFKLYDKGKLEIETEFKIPFAIDNWDEIKNIINAICE